MDDDKLQQLKDRIIMLKENLWPLSMPELKKVEEKFDIKVSNEFKRLNSIYRYDCFSLFEFYVWGLEDETSVIGATLGYRKVINLPKEWLVLAEEGEMCVLMKTYDSPEIPSTVIFCSLLGEIQSLCTTNTIPEKIIRVFDTFMDFYAYLIEFEEEWKQREVESSQNNPD